MGLQLPTETCPVAWCTFPTKSAPQTSTDLRGGELAHHPAQALAERLDQGLARRGLQAVIARADELYAAHVCVSEDV